MASLVSGIVFSFLCVLTRWRQNAELGQVLFFLAQALRHVF